MAYIGRDIQYGVLDKQSFTANGSTTVFTLDSGVKDAKSLLVSVGGVIQEPDVAYTASGTTLTFTAAPANGLVAYAVYLGKELTTASGVRESITFQTGTGDGSDTTPITLSTAPENAQSLMVMLNGVTQVPVTDYTVSGTTLTFTTAPDSGMGILVYHLGKAAAIGTLADNSVTNSKIVTLDAAKLTGSLPSGMFADTTSIDQTIASLGIHVAVADNKASFNLPGVFIDQFESDTGILTETTVDRDTTGEYVSSVQGTFYGTQHTVTSTATANHSTTQAKFGASSIYSNATGKLSIADHSDFTFGTNDFTIEMWIHTGVGNRVCGQYTSSAADTSFTSWLGGAGTQMHWKFYYGTSSVQIGGGANLGDNAWHHVAAVRNGNTFSSYVDGVLANSTSSAISLNDSSQPVIFGEGRDNGGGGYIGYLDDIRISNTARYTSAFSVPSAAFAPDANTLLLIGSDTTDGSTIFTDNNGTQTVSATGTLISTASTAPSATTEASGVMVYENSSGTATLGTDLKAYFSADDGANWTEVASYGSTINFNGASKKLVKLGKTTGLTSGTQMKLKAEWANQAATTYGSQAQVAQGTGTAIGDMTQNGGLSAAFDGTTSQAATSVASLSVPQGQVSWIGKDWGNGVTKTITGFKHYASSDDGTTSNGANSSNCTITLYGSNTNNTATATSLGGLTGLGDFRTNSATHTKLSGLTDTTAYRYHWLKFTTPSNGQIFAAEVEFYETPAGVTGKETRLHGWALNY
jgi:hypothetical protein